MGDPWETQGLHGGASGDLREALGEPWVGLEGLLGPSKESGGIAPASFGTLVVSKDTGSEKHGSEPLPEMPFAWKNL